MDDNSFFSIDRLVEFGMSAAIAQQMVNSMNVAMAGMNIPGSMPKVQPAPPVYYVALEGKPVGPLNESELSQLIYQKKVNKDTLAWMPGMTGWRAIEKVPAILKIVALTPPELPK